MLESMLAVVNSGRVILIITLGIPIGLGLIALAAALSRPK